MPSTKYILFFVLLLCVSYIQSKQEAKQNNNKQDKTKENDKKEEKKKDPKMESYANDAHKRPTKCQVCRVLMQELADEVNKTSAVKDKVWLTNRLDGEDKKDASKGKQIDYKKSEMRLYDILEHVCKKVYNYRSIAGPEFPYLKGVKSMFRQNLEEMMASNGLSLKLDAPEEMVEDPTFEIKRMMFQCNQMVEEYEEDIVEWYLKAQETDPVDFLCAERIIDTKFQSCLTASTEVPSDAKQPLPKDPKDKPRSFTNGAKLEL